MGFVYSGRPKTMEEFKKEREKNNRIIDNEYMNLLFMTRWLDNEIDDKELYDLILEIESDYLY